MPAATQVYYWPREFVLRSYDYASPRSYRRAAISIIVAGRGEFSINIENHGVASCRGLVLGPLASRSQLQFLGSNWSEACWIFDVAPGTKIHRGLLEWLERKPVQLLPAAQLLRIQQQLQTVDTAECMTLEQARSLHQSVCHALLAEDVLPACDHRVLNALSLIDQAALDEVSIAAVAKNVDLSESRLRSLVRRELACNLPQYARWSAAWKTILHWRPGMTLTDAAHAAGFHDLAHANHAANDMFGLSPSRALDNARVSLFAEVDARPQAVDTSARDKTLC
ncbi:MAG: helix-turn-helix domain-containing protein [Oceanococcus sp.]